MKILFHFSVIGFSNSYVVGGDSGGDAVLIAPGHMDLELLKLIEDNGYNVSHVLLTHRHESHTQGLKTLSKIYSFSIYANSPHIYDFPVNSVADGSQFTLAGFEITALLVPGHSADSIVYKIGDALFTGDVITAGHIGSTESSLSRSLLLRSIREKILPFSDNTLIFPGHGAPTLLGVEKRFNPAIMPHRHGEEQAPSRNP